MNQIVAIVLPVFGIIGVGYLVAWSGLFTTEVGDGLADFVYTVPIPVLLFRTFVTAELPGGETQFLLWLAYFTGFAAAWVIGTLMVRRIFHRDARAGVVGGMSAAYSNAFQFGIPLVVAAYGHEALAPMALIVAVQVPVLMVLSALLIERALILDGVGGSTARFDTILTSVGRNLLLNPIVIGMVAGIAWRLTGLTLPSVAQTVVDRIADVAGTLALIAMGLGLRKYGLGGNLGGSIVMSVLKLFFAPAVVLLIVLYVVPLPVLWAKVAIITAALPSGGNVYLVAARFRTGEALASSAIVLSTGLSILSLTFWLAIAAML